MEKLRIFTERHVEQLTGELASPNDHPSRIQNYKTGDRFEVLEDCNRLTTNIELQSESCNLTVDTHSKQTIPRHDAENAVRVFEFIGPLPRSQAVDKRLWVTLAHDHFWSYTQQRWNVSQLADTSAMNLIRVHSFVGGSGLAGLRRNSVARLWWAAHLTMAPWEGDAEFACFESDDRARFTKVMLSQQQVFSDVMERSYGSSKKVRICFLDALDHGMRKVSRKDDLVKSSSKRLGLLLAHKRLDALPVSKVRQELNDLINDCLLE